jgi:hypothetical protein
MPRVDSTNRKVRSFGAPDLVGSLDRDAAQQVGVNLGPLKIRPRSGDAKNAIGSFRLLHPFFLACWAHRPGKIPKFGVVGPRFLPLASYIHH